MSPNTDAVNNVTDKCQIDSNATNSDICIVGAGTMGLAIGELALWNNLKVIFVVRTLASVEKNLDKIRKFLTRQAQKSKNENVKIDSLMQNVQFTTDLESAVRNSEFVLEAIVEEKETKIQLYQKIQEINKDIVIATNTSAISITEMAKDLKHPEKLCGLHFFIPVHAKKYVELPTTMYTSTDTIHVVSGFAFALNLKVLKCKDTPGFVVNRLFVPMLNAAHRLVDEQVFEDIEMADEVIKSTLGWPMGPFELSDFVGLDSLQNIIREIGLQLETGVIKESSTLKNLVANGNLGVKSGKGFRKQTKN